ncbi:TetR/AcrR family transcriptional regulator [Nocardioides sp. YIM 152315]|uniref:TetR/AcrR family transcriptional regulator n=1 Tax=Nocardioides sp. YIM 152315 TaxID=3031760 RepID=UPI0023DCAFD2|nr:TetR/AcrR family transcriptional regulator [Nocardioides sp. YIM 152315]MDF1606336.1 helix-turn-helix domain containing protein [Nocardioides sp. YIM 152315]
MKTTRRYTMTARAEAVERTRLRLLDAAIELAETRLVSEISLDDIAATAGVSVQTLLRHFGSRAGLIEAARRHALTVVGEERRTPIGDPDAAVRTVLQHYERRGDTVVTMLAQEHADAATREVTDAGRAFHRAWVAEVFGPLLPDVGAEREVLTDLLCVATDVYTWKQLRRDRGLGPAATETRVRALVRALLPA